ncbi:MAG TPA: sigma-54 dependent transcriptional regulator [Gammaproteobacteria bacterium]
METTTVQLLSRIAGSGTTLLIAASSAESAQGIAQQFEFFGVEPVIVKPAEIARTLERIEPPLGLLAVAGPGPEAESARREVLEVALARTELPLIVYESDAEAAGAYPNERVFKRLRPPVSYSALIKLVRDLRLIHAQGGLKAEDSQLRFRSLVGRSAAMQAVREMILRVAPWEATVQLRGETGTGKEVVARNIHYHSARRDGPFVAVNCGAIPAELLESELFGHEKGAFTGALTARKGRFELAAGGTLFLDEIGDMPLEMQVKLLRVLQERRFEPLGSSRVIEADVRIIAATHRDLEAMTREGKFREDLYYRLNVVPIHLPPLRERREDLPLLIAEINAQLQRRGMPGCRFDTRALRALVRYDWPGNVRELANLIERCAILAANRDVTPDDLPEPIRRLAPAPDEMPSDGDVVESLMSEVGLSGLAAGGGSVPLKNLLEDIEMRLIRQALESSEGVVAQAAKRLGLRRTTLVEKMRKFQIGRWEEATEF